jgi:hypothetical protein
MTSPKQQAANRLNAIKSTGPRTQEGIRSASLNSVKHRLSLPVTEQFFGEEIEAVTALVRAECVSEHQAKELAKRIIDYERNEQFFREFNTDEAQAELKAWMYCAPRFELIQLAKAHENKQKAWVTFTTPNKKPKGRERVQELQFIKGFVRIQDKALLGNLANEKSKQSAAIRYQKRAVNQLVKAVNHVANVEEF